VAAPRRGVTAVQAAPDPAALFQGLPMAVLLLRPDRSVAAANSAAESLLERGVKRIVGQPLTKLLAFEDARINDALRQGDANLASHRTALRLSTDIVRRVDMALAPVGQQFEGWQMLVLIDLAGRTQGFEGDPGGEGAALRGPEILAHEIKNPLAAIKGAAQLIERGGDEAERRLTSLIRAEVDRIAGLIDQMQTLSQRTSMPVGPCIIYEPIARARDILETAHPGKVRIVESFDPSIPPVLASGEALVQVLLNLMTNALEACQQAREPSIQISTKFVSGVSLRLSRDNRSVKLPVEIRISDNGPGIASDIADDIFSPFVSTKPHSQGLGLALVQKLVRDMNGRIVHDRDDARALTHFRLFLPLA